MKANILRAIAVVFVCGYGVFAWQLYQSGARAEGQIAAAEKILLQPSPQPAAIIRFDGVQRGLVVPYWQWTNQDRIWAYAAPTQPIELSYTPELTELPVPHGRWLPTKHASSAIEQPLRELFAAAEAAGQPLIITSAYRSADEQRVLLDEYLQTMGREWTTTHVTQPGRGEHQLGLAVDLSTYTSACEASFSGCQLAPATTAWLGDNAHTHGFILRYPQSKSHITGISYEPWHYRYVGKEMARYVYESGLTFDEISQRILQERTNISGQ